MHSTLIPVLLYRDAPAAIHWLCEVLGFTRHQVFANADGSIAHAELTLGGGGIMLASPGKKGTYAKLLKQPDELGGFSTQGSYVIAGDVNAVYQRALAVNASIVISLQDSEEGRGFTCKDLEGHVWSIGNYNPWAFDAQ